MKHFSKNLVVALSLLAAGFFAAWLRFQPHLGTVGAFTDGVRHYDSFAGEPIRYAVWKTPELVAGEVNSSEGEHRPTLSPDGRWLVFASGERGLNAELWIAEMRAGVAEVPRPLFELNTNFDELAPAFGDHALFFASNRPGGPGGFDLWRANFAGGDFEAPELLEEGLNTPKDEVDPAPLPGSVAIAFASNRDQAGRRGHDFFIARPTNSGTFECERIEELSSYDDDRELAFTADGTRAFFASNRAGVRGSFDLFASLYEAGQWLEPRALEGLNGADSERGPAPSNDGFELLFERESPIGAAPWRAADLFRAESLEVFQRPGPRVGWLDLLLLVALLVLALLAWLAKRWETIEVLYKCFLISLIAHAALLWWFRDIHPEPEIASLQPCGPTYAVRLASNAGNAARLVERGGDVEATASGGARQPAQPERVVSATPHLVAVSDPGAVQLARQAAQPTRVPERVAAAAIPAQFVPTESVQLADSPARTLENLGAATPLAIEAPSASFEVARVALASPTPKRQTSAARNEPAPRPKTQFASRDARSEPVATPSSALADSFATARPSQEVGQLASDENLRTPADFAGQTQLSAASAETQLTDLLPHSAQEYERNVVATTSGPSTPSLLAASAAQEIRAPKPASFESELHPRELDLPRVAENPRPELNPQAGAATPSFPPLRAPADFEPSVPTSTESSALASVDLQALAPANLQPQRRTTRPLEQPQRSATPVASQGDKPRPQRARLRAEERIAIDVDTPTPMEPLEHTPYRARFGPAKERALEEHGGNAQTEAAVAAGLAYLASVQHEIGFWGDARRFDDKYGAVFVGKTGLCMLAFLGAGHTPSSNTEYSNVVARASNFLLSVQRDASGHFGRTSAYSHGIATYALAECFALTKNEELREPLERAVAQILRHQSTDRRDRRRFGGWGYYYEDPERVFDSWPRVSITAWQVMALESARLGGLEVPDAAFVNAQAFLIGALDPQQEVFRYSHDPARLNGAYAILPGSTPAALFALSLLGEDIEGARYKNAWQFLAERAPSEYRYESDEAFVERAQGNLYFWYYGSLASMRRGGSAWRRWNLSLQDALLTSQRPDGSWEPISTYARNYARDRKDDASYSTAMNVLSLEVYYRYFTPLLKVSAARGAGAMLDGPSDAAEEAR